MPTTPTDEVIVKLSSFGLKVEEFYQDERQKSVVSNFGKEGYCIGCCLDWIRRIIQGSGPGYAAKMNTPHNYECDQNLRIIHQTQRMVLVHGKYQQELPVSNQAAHDVTTKLATANTLSANIAKFQNELVDIYNGCIARDTPAVIGITPQHLALIKQYTKTMIVPNPDGYDFQEISTLIDVLDRILGQVSAAKRTLLALQSTAGQQHTVVHNLMKNPGELDSLVDRLRQRQSKNPLKKKFANLVILKSDANLHFSDVETAISHRLDDPKLALRTAQRITFVHGKLGHSLAIFRQAPDDFYFFDPNYGIFNADKNGVKSAIHYLTSELYTQDAPLVKNLNYEIFALK
jgi:hypothetical protein